MKRTAFILIACTLTAGILLAQRPSQGEEFEKWMKDAQAQLRAFTEAYNSMDFAKASAAVDALQKDFALVEQHYQKAQRSDAAAWSKDVRLKMEEAQVKLKLRDISYSLNLLELAQKNCKACHAVYKAAPTKSNEP